MQNNENYLNLNYPKMKVVKKILNTTKKLIIIILCGFGTSSIFKIKEKTKFIIKNLDQMLR
jgi:hypothetical protein